MSNIAFKVYERNIKENKNILTKTGQVPGVIYGEFINDKIPIKMSSLELRKMLRKNNNGSIIEFDLDGKKMNCVVKEIQRNYIQQILHIDLQYVKENEVIKMKIPVKFVGQPSLEARRLLLETYNPFINFQGNVEKIPEYIEVNVSDMNFDDKVFVKDIAVPDGVAVLTDPKTLLAVVNS